MMDFKQTPRTYFKDVSTSYAFLAATDWTTANERIAGKAKHTIHVVRIALSVTTDNAATQTFQDTADTPVLIAKSAAGPGTVFLEWDFGPLGFALTEGKGLSHLMSATGMAGAVTIEAYLKPSAASITPAEQ